jgi:hypothetical protein
MTLWRRLPRGAVRVRSGRRRLGLRKRKGEVAGWAAQQLGQKGEEGKERISLFVF